jgi:putative endopeptidase
MRKIYLTAAIIPILLTIGCKQHEKVTVLSEQRTVFFDKTGIDSTTNPANDFFTFANGSWIKNAKIPDEYSRWGSFTTLYEENLKKLKALLEHYASESNTAGSLQQKAGDFYTSAMDTLTIEKNGWKPLKPYLDKIDAVKDYKQLLDVIAEDYRSGNGDLLGLDVGADEKNSSRNIGILYQSGLTFPEKGYYTRKDATTAEQRKKLVELVTTYFKLLGDDTASATKKGTEVLALETKMAASHRTPVELRDPQSNYNKFAVDQFEKMSPNLGWKHLFSIMGVNTDSVNVGQPQYFKSLSALLGSEPIEVWKTKVKFDLVNNYAPFLSKDFQLASFNFTKELTGQKKMLDRWKQSVQWSDMMLKDVVGELYVKEYFPPEAKARMDTLVNNLQTAFHNRITKLDWMSDSTKQKALYKLSTFLKKIGYPSKWKDYSDVTIDKANLFGNLQSLGKHNFSEKLRKIGNPVDRTEWGMTPATVNAYYNPTFNEIVFPAGILQFPFFDMHADDAINYGAIGMVIGHEMTHGFDDQGCQYDADGNMKNWWQPADAKKFKAKTAIMVDQYNSFPMFDSLHVNGSLTLGENLADLGGLNIAFDAFKLTKEGQSNQKIDGFTPDQRFFFGFAQIWRQISRPEMEKTALNVDPHSPAKYRINGPLQSFEPFYTTFNITDKNKMYRKEQERVKVW